MEKILILWHTWMLWSAIEMYFKIKWFKLWLTSTSWLNSSIKFDVLNDILNIENIINFYDYDYVINCIWTIRPNDTISEIQNTYIINSYFPKILNDLSIKYDFKFIHFSTDCVFNWKKWNYSIENIPNELWLYGLSKYLWEVKWKNTILIRTSIIWIENKTSKNLLNWFLLNKKWSKLKWYSNVIWNGVTTLVIWKIIERIINNNIKVNWLIQVSSNKINKYDLLILFQKIFNTDFIIEKNGNIKSDKSLISSDDLGLFTDLILPLEDQILELKEFYNL